MLALEILSDKPFCLEALPFEKKAVDFRIVSRPDLQGSSYDPVMQLSEESSKVGRITQYLNHGFAWPHL